MEVIEAQKLCCDVAEKINRKKGLDWHTKPLAVLADLVEEVGEIAEFVRAKEAYHQEPKENIEDELADVFYDLALFAKIYAIDLGGTIEKRMQKLQEKFG